MLQHDVGKWSTEYLYSSDVALLGWRGLYNFGRDPRTHPDPPELRPDKPVGRFSAGAELYYGVLNKSAGSTLYSPPSKSASMPPIKSYAIYHFTSIELMLSPVNSVHWASIHNATQAPGNTTDYDRHLEPDNGSYFNDLCRACWLVRRLCQQIRIQHVLL